MEEITTLVLSECRGVRAEIEKLLVFWCVKMHRSLTWPRDGWYRCRVCGRCYAVPWEEGDRMTEYARKHAATRAQSQANQSPCRV